jgi:hypothetical protein
MAKKTFNEKLNFSGDLPKVTKITKPRFVERYKADTMLIAAPLEYDGLMTEVPKGKLTTIDRMMTRLAKKHKAGCACPMTAGIFVNVAANASEERIGKDETPWWRTLKKDGLLNEKFPGGAESQKLRLEAEGHTISKRASVFSLRITRKNCSVSAEPGARAALTAPLKIHIKLIRKKYGAGKCVPGGNGPRDCRSAWNVCKTKSPRKHKLQGALSGTGGN